MIPNSNGPSNRANNIVINKAANCLTNAPERSQMTAVLDLAFKFSLNDYSYFIDLILIFESYENFSLLILFSWLRRSESHKKYLN